MAEEEEDELNGREMVATAWSGGVGGGWLGGWATSLRGALKKTKAAPRRRVQCADSPGRVYAQPTNKRDLLSTCMETF